MATPATNTEKKPKKGGYLRLGDLLISAGLITEEQLQEGLAKQSETHERLGEALITAGIITERQLLDALQIQLGVDYVDLGEAEIDPEMTKVIPRGIAKKYSVVPLRTVGDELYLVMADPLNFMAMEEARTVSRMHVVPMISTRAGIDHAISQLYGTEGAKRATHGNVARGSNQVGRAGDFGIVVCMLGAGGSGHTKGTQKKYPFHLICFYV